MIEIKSLKKEPKGMNVILKLDYEICEKEFALDPSKSKKFKEKTKWVIEKNYQIVKRTWKLITQSFWKRALKKK